MRDNKDNKAAMIVCSLFSPARELFEPFLFSSFIFCWEEALPKLFGCARKAKGPGQAVSKQRAPVQQPCTKEGVLGVKRGRPSSGETAKGLVLSLRKSAKAVKSSAA